MADSSLGDAGAIALAQALRTNSAIATLHLWGCAIRATGAAALAEAVHANTASALTTLYAGGNPIGQAGERALRAVFTKEPARTALLELSHASWRRPPPQRLVGR